MEYIRPMYFRGSLPYSFLLDPIFGLTYGPINIFKLSSLKLTRYEFLFIKYLKSYSIALLFILNRGIRDFFRFFYVI